MSTDMTCKHSVDAYMTSLTDREICRLGIKEALDAFSKMGDGNLTLARNIQVKAGHEVADGSFIVECVGLDDLDSIPPAFREGTPDLARLWTVVGANHFKYDSTPPSQETHLFAQLDGQDRCVGMFGFYRAVYVPVPRQELDLRWHFGIEVVVADKDNNPVDDAGDVAQTVVRVAQARMEFLWRRRMIAAITPAPLSAA